MQVSEAAFTVTDTETTGISPSGDRLIELAAVRVVDGVVTDTFTELINPQRSIPAHISRLTGITGAMVYSCPTSPDVLRRFLDFLGGSVLVAHNLNFDYRFLNSELAAAGMPLLDCSTLCTLRLARRLLPGLRSKSLRSLTEFYKITNRRAHRALGDAEATAFVLIRLLDILKSEHGAANVDDVLRFQHRTYRSASRSPHLSFIRKNILPKVPAVPGVYFMRDSAGVCIYVGKARDLRARISSYFSAIEGHVPRIRRMVDVVRTVDWQESETELEAMLLESSLIKELQPRFNRAQLEYKTRPFFRLGGGEAFPSLGIAPVLKDDGAAYFGPFENRVEADRIKRVIDRFFLLRKCSDKQFAEGRPCEHAAVGRCGAPCAGLVSQEVYAEEQRRVFEFLAGRDESIFQVIDSAMRRAAVAMRYEDAAELRDLVSTVSKKLERDGCIAPAVLDQNAVFVLTDAVQRSVQVHFVRFGRMVDSVTLDPTANSIRKRILTRIERHFKTDTPHPARYDVEEAEEVRVLRQWAYANRHMIARIQWQADTTTAEFGELVCNAIDQTISAARSGPALSSMRVYAEDRS